MTQIVDAEQPKRVGADKLIVGFLAAVVLIALFFVFSQRQQALRNSPAGLDGLQIWLSQDDLDVQSFMGGWPVNANEIGLQIIPIYDTKFREDRTPPDTKEALILQQDEFDADDAVLRKKAAQVPALIVLPKWRSGMRLTGFAHPVLLNDANRVGVLASSLVAGPHMTLSYAGQPFTDFAYEEHQITLYAAQMLSAPQCEPIIGTKDAMVLGRCPLLGNTADVFLLSDPDLLNNHGLRLGENAFAIRDWVRQVAGDQRVMIDYGRNNWLTEDVTRSTRDREWSDLLRFFQPPFTTMWAGLVLSIALTLWRAGIRFGPALAGPQAIGASKMLAIGARAKLLRLSNLHGALAGEYVKARLAATATTLFGTSQANQFTTPDAFVAFTQRRHPQHAPALIAALNSISTLPDHAPASQAMASVAALDRILETITHDT